MSILLAPLSPEEQDERYMHLVPEIDAIFQEGYDDTTLEYHVWTHGLSTFDKNKFYRDELRALGIPGIPGEFMTHIDSKGHDFRLKKFFDLKRNGNNTYSAAEDLTVSEGSEVLRAFGVDDFTVQEFGDNIIGTKVGVRCNTWGRFTLCAADLRGTGEDYETVMKPDTEKLRVEKENLEEIQVDPARFAVGSLVLLARYHFENLYVPLFLSQSLSAQEFYEAQGSNLRKLGIEAASLVGLVGEEKVNEFLQKLGSQVARLCPITKKN